MLMIELFVELNFFILFYVGMKLGFYFGWVDIILEEKEDRKFIIFSLKNLIFMNMLLVNKEGVDGKKINNLYWVFIGDIGNGKLVMVKILFM